VFSLEKRELLDVSIDPFVAPSTGEQRQMRSTSAQANSSE
jgi:hypothetical protein